MAKIFIELLGYFYVKIPKEYRPYVKKIVYWLLVRLQSIVLLRPICKGKRIAFLDFEIAYLEQYEFLGPNKKQIQVKVHRSVISPGTENAVLSGLPGARRYFPYYPGYSAAATVLKCGRRVSQYKPGDRVAGRIKHLSNSSISPENLFQIPAGVSNDDACFIEIGIIGLQGIRKAGIKPGDKVAVLGQGLIGQMANRLAKLVGASSVIAIASSSKRRFTAIKPGGADEFIALSENNTRLFDMQADVVIEAVGAPKAITTAMQCSRDYGKVILLGSSRGLGRDIEWLDLAQKRNLQIIGAHISAMPNTDNSYQRWTYHQEGKLFLSLLENRRLEVADLVTWFAKPDECNKAYEIIAEGGAEHVGIVFNWDV